MEAWLRSGTTTNVPGLLGVRQSHQEHLVKCSGIEAALKESARGPVGHHHTEQDPHIWLGIILNGKVDMKNPEVWKAVREHGIL